MRFGECVHNNLAWSKPNLSITLWSCVPPITGQIQSRTAPPPTSGPENRVVNMENISKSTQIQPKRAIMAYGLPMQLSGAVGPTNTIKSHLGSDCFWCWSHVVFANTADSGIAPRKWPGLKKGILPVLGRKEPICWSRLDLSGFHPILMGVTRTSCSVQEMLFIRRCTKVLLFCAGF